MIGSVSQSENAPKITLSEFTDPEEMMDKDLDTRVMGKRQPSSGACFSLSKDLGRWGFGRGSNCDPGYKQSLRH